MSSRAEVEDSEESLLRSSLKAMREAGFDVSTPPDDRRTSLDVVARRRDILLVAKAVEDIEETPEALGRELRRAASALSAIPILIASRKGGEAIEDGVVYGKMNIWAASPTTIINALRGEGPYVYSKLNRYYVHINGEGLRAARLRKGLSLGDLARMVGVSRKAIYEYERGSMDATLEVALKIEEALESSLIVPVDILAPLTSRPPPAEKEGVKPLEGEVLSKLRELGFEAFHFKRAPFNVIARSKRTRLLVKVSGGLDEQIERELSVVRSMAHVSGCLSLTIVKEEALRGEGDLLPYGEFKKVESEPELIEIIGQRPWN
jgi:putative transcriptional regulator